jgi:glycosyltransferase involved in cell wall biosynthesis
MLFDAKFWKTKVLYRIDECLSVALNLMLVAAALAGGCVYRLWKRGRLAKPHGVVFLSCEGIKVAPTRVRCYHFAEVLRRQGVDAEVFAYWDEFSRLAHFPFPFRRIWEVEKFFCNVAALARLLPRGPVVIFEQRPNYDFLVPLCLKLINGSRIVMDIDDWTLSYRAFCFPMRLEVRHMLPFFALMSDTCVVSSRRLRERLGRHFRNLPLLPTYVDHARFIPAEKEDAVAGGPVVFSWVGTIFQDFTYDNVMFMVEAFARACDILGAREGLALDIVGGGDYFNRVQERVAREFAEYPVRVRPWMAPEAMPAYLRSIDVGLYCLLDPSAFHESKSPTKIFEYYACAKPVVSTRLGEAKYFVEHGRTGYLAEGIEEYAKAMADMARDPEGRKAMGLAGLAMVRAHWNMETACKELRSILLPDDPRQEDTRDARWTEPCTHSNTDASLRPRRTES